MSAARCEAATGRPPNASAKEHLLGYWQKQREAGVLERDYNRRSPTRATSPTALRPLKRKPLSTRQLPRKLLAVRTGLIAAPVDLSCVCDQRVRFIGCVVD